MRPRHGLGPPPRAKPEQCAFTGKYRWLFDNSGSAPTGTDVVHRQKRCRLNFILSEEGIAEGWRNPATTWEFLGDFGFLYQVSFPTGKNVDLATGVDVADRDREPQIRPVYYRTVEEVSSLVVDLRWRQRRPGTRVCIGMLKLSAFHVRDSPGDLVEWPVFVERHCATR